MKQENYLILLNCFIIIFILRLKFRKQYEVSESVNKMNKMGSIIIYHQK